MDADRDPRQNPQRGEHLDAAVVACADVGDLRRHADIEPIDRGDDRADLVAGTLTAGPLRDRMLVRAEAGMAKERTDRFGHIGREQMLKFAGIGLALLDRHAEDIDDEPLRQAVAADDLFSHLAATRGAVVLFSSTNGRTGGSAVSGAAYAVAKAGIINLARFLARDWASAGVRVNCIAPGPVDTVMLDRLGAAGRARLLKTIPLGRFSSADQVAAQVVFLLSDDCAAVSGEVFNTSGALVLD